jgi:hypothetical protein
MQMALELELKIKLGMIWTKKDASHTNYEKTVYLPWTKRKGCCVYTVQSQNNTMITGNGAKASHIYKSSCFCSQSHDASTFMLVTGCQQERH